MNTGRENLFSCGLDAASIDSMSEVLAQNLQDADFGAEEILKMRLTAESVMQIWAERLGEDTACSFVRVQRFGHTSFLLCADGCSVDPVEFRDELMLSVGNSPNLAAALGLSIEYRYTGGRNELKLAHTRKKVNAGLQALIALAAAILLSVPLRRFLPGAADWICAQLVVPFADTMTNILHLIAGPLIFLSIVSGITGLGDGRTFAEIGSTLVRRFMKMTVLCAVLVWASVSWIFPVSFGAGTGAGTAFSDILAMILNIIPSDIVSPFQDGNAVQIIFTAIACGIGCIFLGRSVGELVRVVDQANTLVMRMMMWISRLMPLYIFLCAAELVLNSDMAELYEAIFPILLITAASLVMPLVYGAYAAIRAKVPFGKMIRSQLPTWLLALSTASSTAAFQSNVECCEKDLHLDSRLVRVGIPFGQVTFMPGFLIVLIYLPMFMAKQYDVPITPEFILMMLITAAILAVATPPIPGGGIASMIIILSELGIPLDMMAVCAAILTFTDYTITACNIVCLQQELVIIAKKLGLKNVPDD